MRRPTNTERRALLAAVLVLWAVSLALPAVTGDLDAPDTTAPGLQALLMGWIFNPVAWLANVLLLIGISKWHRGRDPAAEKLGVAATACATIPWAWSQGLTLETGYYVWWSAMVIFVLGASCLSYRRHRVEGPEPASRSTRE